MVEYILATIVLLSTSAYGSTNGYDLKMDLTMNGKYVSSPRVKTTAGTTTTITQKLDAEEYFIEVVTNEGELLGNKGILMKFVVGTIGENGHRTVVSRPSILTSENELSEIIVGEDEEIEAMRLSVTAQRTTL